MQSWSTEVAFGSPGVATFVLRGERPIRTLTIDLIGDGLEAPTVIEGVDLRKVLAASFVPPMRGRFELQIRVRDAAGCEGMTGLRRDVVVH